MTNRRTQAFETLNHAGHRGNWRMAEYEAVLSGREQSNIAPEDLDVATHRLVCRKRGCGAYEPIVIAWGPRN
ncbi:MAG: hypothetical protein ACE361_12185 [Aureliella sp.]